MNWCYLYIYWLSCNELCYSFSNRWHAVMTITRYWIEYIKQFRLNRWFKWSILKACIGMDLRWFHLWHPWRHIERGGWSLWLFKCFIKGGQIFVKCCYTAEYFSEPIFWSWAHTCFCHINFQQRQHRFFFWSIKGRSSFERYKTFLNLKCEVQKVHIVKSWLLFFF